MKNKGGSLLGGALLIAGTSIGAGMLALPLKTGVAGFGPSMVVNLVCWAFMLCTGLLFLEVTLWMPDMSNLLSMARRFLGIPGQAIAGVCFLFLYYCLMVAYFSGLGSMVGGVWIFAIAFGAIIFLGAGVAGRINYILMAGLIVSYLLLIVIGAGDVQGKFLLGGDWPLALLAMPTLFAAYGYHNVIPSVSTYMQRDAHKLRWAIFIGTTIPLVAYSLWQWLIIGTVPQEVIAQALEAGAPVSQPLEMATASRWIPLLARYFALFAIVTSVIGVSLSMVDFIGDGTKIERKGFGRLILCLIVFAPPVLFASTDPALFYKALHFAGIYGEAVLNGLFPIVMVWIGRYRKRLSSDYQLPGGRWTLAILLLITVAIIVFEPV